MKYAYTIFYIENVTKTIEFYERAFGFERRFITPEEDYGELQTGETRIAFANIALGESNFREGFEKIGGRKRPLGFEMAFVSEEIESDFQRALDAGAVEVEKICQKPWGQKVGYLRDINGLLIEICTPMEG